MLTKRKRHTYVVLKNGDIFTLTDFVYTMFMLAFMVLTLGIIFIGAIGRFFYLW